MTKVFLSKVSTKRLIQLSGWKSFRDTASSRHKLVMSLFPQGLGTDPRATAKILYRVERNTKEGFVLIQSTIAPANLKGVLSREFSQALKTNDTVRFRLTITPVKRHGNKETSLNTEEDIWKYAEAKLNPALTDIQRVGIKQEDVPRTNGSKNFIRLVQLDGIARILEADKLEELIINGVGRGKSYGAGLITVQVI